MVQNGLEFNFLFFTENFCLVCTDKSTGTHYGVKACEGCKSFFQRTTKNEKTLTCRNYPNKKCVITRLTRNNCGYCRYQACLQQGMNTAGKNCTSVCFCIYVVFVTLVYVCCVCVSLVYCVCFVDVCCVFYRVLCYVC